VTSRERLLTTVRHGMADRLPWAPKFGTWFRAHLRRGDLPHLLEGCAHWHDGARRIGVDIFDKSGAVTRTLTPSVKTEESIDGPRTVTRQITPLGELVAVREEVEDYAHTVYLTQHPVRAPEDIRVYRYILDDTVYEPCYDAYREVDRSIGEDGITMTNLPDSPLHRIFVSLMGYEAGSLAFADEPRAMEELCRAILRKNEEAYPLAAASPAEVLLTGENTNADFESPDLFRRYAFPTFRRASEIAHGAGKLSWIHACGKLRVLLPQFREAGIDGVESLTPPPYADTELWEARQAWRGEITIDGGVSPHLLVGRLDDRAMEACLLNLFSRMDDGRNFVLSVSDDTPTDAVLDRLVRVGELVREHGRLPLRHRGGRSLHA